MKLIILAAGRTNTTDSSVDPPPKCLRRYDEESTVLDRIVAAGEAAGCTQVAVVGGYQILSIMEAYPSFKYYYNPAWETTGSLASLLQAAPELTRDVLVAYSDVVFDPECTAILGERLRDDGVGWESRGTNQAGARVRLVVATDSAWATRYEGRTAEIRTDAEKLYRLANGRLKVTRARLGGSGTGLQDAAGQQLATDSSGRSATTAAPGGRSTAQNGSTDANAPTLVGEFAGVFGIAGESIPAALEAAEHLVARDPKAGIGDLVTALSADLAADDSAIVDFEGAWAELDNEQDLARFRFGTKAETLQRLRGRLKGARVLPQLTVRVGQWRADPDRVVADIAERFSGSLVVRSSALNEDTATASLAGSYESVLDVPAGDRDAVTSAIESVCASYAGRGDAGVERSEPGRSAGPGRPVGTTVGERAEDPANQVLIQPMVSDVVLSGVAFTADLETGAPYYTINYDTSGSTESVTSGTAAVHRTLVFHKASAERPADAHLAALLDALSEIEAETGFSSLDVEFAVVRGGEVVIFQVRPIAAHKNQLRVSARDVERELAHVARYLEFDAADSTVLSGRSCAWGIMPDWNPAEIIGVNPRPLSFSLYRHIITDEVWGRSREQCGYRATRPRPGIVDFAGKPYVDVRMSFTSFTPAALDPALANTVVDGAVRYLLDHPELHDKVEFAVMPTAFDLDFDAFLKEVRRRAGEGVCNAGRADEGGRPGKGGRSVTAAARTRVDEGHPADEEGPPGTGGGADSSGDASGATHARAKEEGRSAQGDGPVSPGSALSGTVLTDADIDAIRFAYRDLTDAIIAGRGISVEGELRRIDRLSERRERVVAALGVGSVSPAAGLAVLLDDCREFGTLPFSNLARFAFVGIIQLRVLVRRGLLSPERVDAFLASIRTVAKEFVHDLATLDRDALVRRYGHLRPGTYDITSPAYHEAFDRYVDLSRRPEPDALPSFVLTDAERTVIDRELLAAGFSVDADALLAFVRAAVQGRELGKFEFSRNLSLAIDLIAAIAEREGLTRDEASFLSVDDFLALAGGSRPSGLSSLWRSISERKRRRHLVTSAIKLPPVITSPRDLSLFEIVDEIPNFITRKVLTAPVVDLIDATDTDALPGALVLIENADPGYDWIFSHGIAGLVTRFGGANSHMTIRCAEFEIPAAIGCGEAIYERLLRAQVARLDCDGKRIEVVR